jgi:hypothetical protein
MRITLSSVPLILIQAGVWGMQPPKNFSVLFWRLRRQNKTEKPDPGHRPRHIKR